MVPRHAPVVITHSRGSFSHQPVGLPTGPSLGNVEGSPSLRGHTNSGWDDLNGGGISDGGMDSE